MKKGIDQREKKHFRSFKTFARLQEKLLTGKEKNCYLLSTYDNQAFYNYYLNVL